MNEHAQPSHGELEEELSRLRPAEPPRELLARLAAIPENRARTARATATRFRPGIAWRQYLRWLAPGAVAAVALWLFAAWLADQHRGADLKMAAPPTTTMTPTSPALHADRVDIDRQFVAAYDTIARLPDGEPVRVYCREWVDEVVVRDTARGVAVTQRTPRVEVIPVSFETF